MLKWNKKSKTEKQPWKRLKENVDAIIKSTDKTRCDMDRYLKIYNGEIFNSGVEGEDVWGRELTPSDSKASVNLAFSTVEAVAPMLTDSKPITHVIARQPFLANLAESYNQALSYMWDKEHIPTKIYELVKNGMIMGLGVMKVWFDPSRDNEGELAIDNIDPRDFFIAPGYTDIWDAPLCGVKVKKPIMWVKERFPNVKKIKCSNMKDEVSDYSFDNGQDSDLSTRFVNVYEVWMRDETLIDEEISEEEDDRNKSDRKKKYPNGKFVYFTDSQFLGEEPSLFNHGRPPYVTFTNYSKPFEFVGAGEINQIEGLVKEVNYIYQKISNHIRNYCNTSYLADVGAAIDPDNLKTAIRNGGEVIPWDSQMGTRGLPVVPLIKDVISGEVIKAITIYQKWIDLMSGVTDVSRGMVGKNERQSASEIAMLTESSNTRTRQKVRNLEDTIEKLGYLIVSTIMQFWDSPRKVYEVKEEGTAYMELSNSWERALLSILPPELQEQLKEEEEGGELATPEAKDALKDYERFVEAFGNETDPVYFDFEIAVGAMSTLPMDKQVRAQMHLRLAGLKRIANVDLYKGLGYPDPEEMAKRTKAENSGGGQ